MSLRDTVLHGLKWSAGGKYLGQLLSWVFTIYVMRLLTPADYGLVSMAGVFMAFALLISELGIGPALIQAKKLERDVMRQSFSLVIILCLSLFLVMFFSAPLLARIYDEPRLVAVTRLMSVQFLVIIFAVIPQALLTREMRFKELSLIGLCSNIIGGITTVALAYSGFGVMSLVYGNLSMTLAGAIGVIIVTRKLYVPSLKMTEIRPLLGYGRMVTLSRVFWFFLNQVDVFIIGKMLGKDILGYYSIGLMLASIPLDKSAGILSQVAFPAYSTLQNEKEKASYYFIKAVRILFFMFVPIMWGMSCLGREIIDIILGSRWSPASIPFQLIALIIPLRMISSIIQPLLDGIGRPDLSICNLIVACLVMPFGFLVGTYFGILGISIAWVVLFPVVFVFNLIISLPSVGLKISDIGSALKNSLLSGAIMYGAVYLLKTQLLGVWSIYSRTAASIVVGGLVYLIMTLMINQKTVDEIVLLFKGEKYAMSGQL